MSKEILSIGCIGIVVNIVIFAVLALGLWFLIDTVFDKISEETERIEDTFLGKKVVIEGDTLTVLDVSPWNENCALSDGTTVHLDVAEKFLVKNYD